MKNGEPKQNMHLKKGMGESLVLITMCKQVMTMEVCPLLYRLWDDVNISRCMFVHLLQII